MNLSAFIFVCHSQPGGWRATYLVFLAVLALAISPVRAAELSAGKGGAHGPDAFFAGALGAVSHAGDGAIFEAKNPVSLFVHAGRPYAEKKFRASLPTARCSAHGVNDNFPPSGRSGVTMQGRARRGTGAASQFRGPTARGDQGRAPGLTGLLCRARGSNQESIRV